MSREGITPPLAGRSRRDVYRPPARRVGRSRASASCERTTRTGQGAWRMTASETLPPMALLMPRWPRHPITIRPAPKCLAKPTISRSTVPILRWVPATVPPATPTPQDSFRRRPRAYMRAPAHPLQVPRPPPEVGAGHGSAGDPHPPGQLPQQLPGLLFDLLVELAVVAAHSGIAHQESRRPSHVHTLP